MSEDDVTMDDFLKGLQRTSLIDATNLIGEGMEHLAYLSYTIYIKFLEVGFDEEQSLTLTTEWTRPFRDRCFGGSE